ncbi:hypothetical protein K466DRAFT_180072 [Polyporus arcularius HHB13444]|uniref:Uncharacterized protein n=1 Tax=Polyporus arcularius HHB13444 TaxID=1314778 RepID=A0A5C3P8V0_9APHY|nr:hypothetical protein K466DRAFT_180072 [Polyporus arcularius HHB13444]
MARVLELQSDCSGSCLPKMLHGSSGYGIFKDLVSLAVDVLVQVSGDWARIDTPIDLSGLRVGARASFNLCSTRVKTSPSSTAALLLMPRVYFHVLSRIRCYCSPSPPEVVRVMSAEFLVVSQHIVHDAHSSEDRPRFPCFPRNTHRTSFDDPRRRRRSSEKLSCVDATWL